MPQGHPGDRFLAHVAQELDRHFRIEHSTIQIEIKDSDSFCVYEPEHEV